MAKRSYLVVFGFQSEKESKFTTICESDKDIAYGQACAKYGYANVGGIYVDNEQNRKYLRAKGFTEI